MILAKITANSFGGANLRESFCKTKTNPKDFWNVPTSLAECGQLSFRRRTWPKSRIVKHEFQ